MSFTGLFAIGVSGVAAYAQSLEAVSNNIANSQSVGFKRARTDFSDLVTIDAAQAGGRIGAGVEATFRPLIAEQGAVTRTTVATNVAVSGEGFFVVADPEARPGTPVLFTRAGDFAPNTAGALQNGAGYLLQGYALDAAGESGGGIGALVTVDITRAPPLPVGAPPAGALVGVSIDADGRVIGAYANGESYALYQIPLALFTNPDGLEDAARSAFQQTTDSGRLALAAPGASPAGAIEASAVELSTVDISAEFSALIETQRAYSTNARILTVADEMWSALLGVSA